MFPFFTVVEASLPPTLYPIHTWPLSTRQSLEKSLAARGLFCSMVPRNTPLLTSPPHLPEASSSFQVVQPFFMSPPLALLLRASSSLDPAQTLSLFYGTSLHVSKEAVAHRLAVAHTQDVTMYATISLQPRDKNGLPIHTPIRAPGVPQARG